MQILPEPEAVGTQHDAAAHGRIGNELRLEADGRVPRGKVGRLRRNLLDDAAASGFGHDRPRFACDAQTAFAPGTRYGRARNSTIDAEAHPNLHPQPATTARPVSSAASASRRARLRIETYGTVDELSSAIGVARAALRPLVGERQRARARSMPGWRGRKTCSSISAASWQRRRRIGAIRTPARRGPTMRERSNARSTQRRTTFRRLTHFIHPGGSLPGAQLHVARTICRRAERLVVALRRAERDGVPPTRCAFSIASPTRSSSGRAGSTTRSASPSTSGIPRSRPPEGLSG